MNGEPLTGSEAGAAGVAVDGVNRVELKSEVTQHIRVATHRAVSAVSPLVVPDKGQVSPPSVLPVNVTTPHLALSAHLWAQSLRPVQQDVDAPASCRPHWQRRPSLRLPPRPLSRLRRRLRRQPHPLPPQRPECARMARQTQRPACRCCSGSAGTGGELLAPSLTVISRACCTLLP